MAGNQSQFDEYIAEDIRRHRGVSYPIHSGPLRRLFVRTALCLRLHPNPEDEFCDPNIGPNYSIVSDYVQTIQLNWRKGYKYCYKEPLIVERIRPDGYMLLNGHHRWAAALRMSVARVPIRIVNLTLEEDLRKMVQNAKHHKRVTLDLDEVVFHSGPKEEAEPRLRFPWNRLYRERLRNGVPALFHHLKTLGYDIWIYTAGYYSMDYLQRCFRHYQVQLDGVVTGLTSRRPGVEGIRNQMQALMAVQYPKTVHIDGSSVLCIDRTAHEFNEFPLSGASDTWAQEVREAIDKYESQTNAGNAAP